MKLFQWVKEIRSKNGVLHFKRYAIFETELLSLYIHKIYEADKDAHLHSHPWNFASVILKGSYVEQYIEINYTEYSIQSIYRHRTKRPLSFGFGSRRYYHKILRIENSPVTSLFFVFGPKKPWYYFINPFKNIESEEYRKLKNEGNLPK
jgi:hypothetical protein